ncbi:hypothetical protein BDV95DRAFT_445603, partial [Massariosphaeria phaeospora]
LALLLQNPPDLNEPLPLANHASTAMGVAIPLHVLAWVAVLLRLYTRFRVLKKPWWDDYTITAAILFDLIFTVTYIGSMHHGGFGQHVLSLTVDIITSSYKWQYVNQWTYATTMILTKISLLLQYLRLFRSGLMRYICMGLLVAVCCWGSVLCFISIFPCFPVEAYWTNQQDATYYGFGYKDYESVRMTVISTAALDILFSVLVYFLPLSLYVRSDLAARQIMALLGLFASGSMVIITSSLRLWILASHTDTELRSADVTWWHPVVMLVSSLELNLALITASIPVFHVYLAKYLAQIFVTKEIIVQRHERMSDQGADYEMDRPGSWKSNTSEERLTR